MAPYKGDIQFRKQGSLIAFESGEAVAYGLFNAQDRGTLFIEPGYQGLCRYGHRPERKTGGY